MTYKDTFKRYYGVIYINETKRQDILNKSWDVPAELWVINPR